MKAKTRYSLTRREALVIDLMRLYRRLRADSWYNAAHQLAGVIKAIIA